MIVLNQAYHRNGIGGNGFVVSLFSWPEADYGVDPIFVAISPLSGEENKREEFIAGTAVLNVSLLQESVIEFGKNSWRGSDHCGPMLWAEWEKLEKG